MMEKIIISAGAPQSALAQVDSSKAAYYIGVDRGAWRLLERDLPLDLALGDFDSVSEEELFAIRSACDRIIILQAEKDDTDMELALVMALEYSDSLPIQIYGGLGKGRGRLDHLIANLWMPLQDRFRPAAQRISFVETNRLVKFYLSGQHQLLNMNDCRYLSIISLTPVKGLMIEGAKYQLSATDYAYPRALISNEFVGQQEVNLSLQEGLVMVIWEKEH